VSDVAVVVVSHGTVDALDDLAAFVTRVRRGRPAPPELVAELRGRYEAVGGSPLNRINEQLAAGLAARLGVTVVPANRLWRPFVRDVFADLARRGIGRVVLLPLAQHSTHVYADDARSAAAATGVELSCAPAWGGRADLTAAYASRVEAGLLASPDAERTTVVMTAHTLPRSVIAAGDPYERDVRASAEAIGLAVRARVAREIPVLVAFQSQGMPGPAPVEWLGPDLREALDAAREGGAARVLFAPIGFLADHVEVLYDLDVQARAMAAERGLAYARTRSLNADDDFVDVLVEICRPLLGPERPVSPRHG
jgi:protoporphyrin/coproporphyrin ferrochelatase